MSDIFISYSRKNKTFAQQLTAQLCLSSKDSWVDWEDIPLTADWWKEIKLGIESAHNFIFVMSPDSLSSVVCNMELDHAIENNKRIIPVVYADVDQNQAFASLAAYIPDDPMRERLGSKKPLEIVSNNWNRLSHINWLFFRETESFDDTFKSLLDIVNTDLDYVKAHTRLLTRAQEWEESKHREDLLIFGKEIALAEKWLVKGKAYQEFEKKNEDKKVSVVNPLPSLLHVEYIIASRKADTRRRTIIWATAITLFSLVIMLLVGGIYTSRQVQQIQANWNRINALELVSGAREVSDDDSIRSIALAMEATKREESPPIAYETLANVAYRPGPVERIPLTDATVYDLTLTRDGTQLFAAVSNGTITVTDTASTTTTIIYTSNETLYTVALSPDESLLAFAGCSTMSDESCIEGEIHIIDRITGGERFILNDHRGAVRSLEFNATGSQLVSGSWDGTLLVWDMDSGTSVQEFAGHTGVVWDAAFDPNGRYILSTADDNTLRRWDLQNPDEQPLIFNGHTDTVLAVDWNNDGTQAVSSSDDGTLILWDTQTGQPQRFLLSHNAPVPDVSYSPDGQTVLSASLDRTVILWDIVSARPLEIFTGHTAPVWTATFAPNADNAYSADEYGRVIDWDLTRDDIIGRFQGHNPGERVRAVRVSPVLTQHQLVTAAEDNTLIVWDTSQDIPQAQFLLSDHSDDVRAVTYNPSGTRIISASSDGTLIVWDATTGANLHTFTGHTEAVTSVAVSPDGTRVASASADTTVKIWDLSTLSNVPLITLSGHTEFVRAVVFLPDGKRLLSASYDQTLILWNLDTGAVLNTFIGHDARIIGLATSSDGQLAVSASEDSTIILWDLNASDGNPQRFVGHTDVVTDIRFGEADRTVISSGWDGRVMLWDVASREPLYTYVAHEAQITGVDFFPDFNRIVSADADGNFIIWRVDDLSELRDWVNSHREVRELLCTEKIEFNLAGGDECELEDELEFLQ